MNIGIIHIGYVYNVVCMLTNGNNTQQQQQMGRREEKEKEVKEINYHQRPYAKISQTWLALCRKRLERNQT